MNKNKIFRCCGATECNIHRSQADTFVRVCACASGMLFCIANCIKPSSSKARRARAEAPSMMITHP